MRNRTIQNYATPQQVMGPATDYSRSVIKFDGANYRLWRKTVEADFAVLGYSSSLDPDMKPTTEDEKTINLKAFSYLLRCLTLEQLELVQDATTPAEIWSFLRKVHANRSQQNLLLLMQELINVKYEEGST